MAPFYDSLRWVRWRTDLVQCAADYSVMISTLSSETSQQACLASWQMAMTVLAQEVQRMALCGVVDADRLHTLRAVVETSRLAYEGFELRPAEG